MELDYKLREPVLPADRIRRELDGLQPKIAWCHRFDFQDGLSTLSADQEPYFTKARGLKIIGRQIVEVVPWITRAGDVRNLRVLDLACAEGAHSLEFAAAGAREVLGIEGRQLYVDRATLAARAYGLENVRFVRGDVRAVSAADPGRYDLVLFLGILHHLDGSVFLDTLRRLREIAGDTLVLFTHTSEPGCETKFGYKLGPEVEIAGGYRGRMYAEHPESATPEQRERRVRNSLDNTYAFWARENSLVQGLKDAGFRYVSRMLHPNPFGDPAGEYRVLYVCR